jgi:hypothetical protein
MGAINLLVLLAQSIIRMFDMYFSIVRRNAAWASRERESASLITTTNKKVRSTSGYYTTLDGTFESMLRVQVYLLRLRNFL